MRPDLGHHSSPGDEVDVASLPSLLLKKHDRLEQAVDMPILAVIKLLESLEPFGQVCTQPRWKVVP